jgi:hypothetical protein
MFVDWTAGIGAPDFPYPNPWNPATLACRDWHLIPKAAWEPGYARLFRFHQKICILAQGALKGRLVGSLTANIVDYSPPTMLLFNSR